MRPLDLPTRSAPLDEPEAVVHDPRVVLRLDEVSKQFGPQQVLHRVSLTLRQGEVLALCGASGSGKSTLIRIVSGLLPFDSGLCTVDGIAVHARQVYPARLYGSIGVIFQDANLFPHLTVLANVALGLRKFRRLPNRSARERGMFELDRMGVLPLADRYPATLSGGERQRVAIARALAMDPLLLLLDEPTANLDPGRVDEVCERIVALARTGTTMLLVTHSHEFARQAAKAFALLTDGVCTYSRDPACLDRLHPPQGC
jgi:glutamate/aspartate transport system ATP-binding protein